MQPRSYRGMPPLDYLFTRSEIGNNHFYFLDHKGGIFLTQNGQDQHRELNQKQIESGRGFVK